VTVSRLRVPGDKSISHRALMLAALGRGTSRVRGILQSADVEATVRVLRALGATIPSPSAPEVVIDGVGLRGLRTPSGPLDCANSGTTARLIAGVVAGAALTAEFVGDVSLSRRPMSRVAAPLRAMGTEVTLAEHGGLPMRIRSTGVRGITWRPDVASAQVKSTVLLAGLVGNVPVEVQELAPTRNHTERMLQARGVDVRVEGDTISLLPSGRLDAVDVDVPGDASSAAFFAGLAAMGATRTLEMRIENVGVNPWRVGAFRALRRMGATLGYADETLQGGEPVATLVCSRGTLTGITIAPDEVPSLIDELPLLAIVAARAEGETRVTGAAELRVKESDRIAAVVNGLRTVGADAEELPDGFVVRGSERPLAGHVVTHGDHRIAMAFGVLGAVPGNRITVDDPSCCAVSWPTFWDALTCIAHA
jgi:3-phosphoshikimate 1-carboxyvinyltransferase